MTSSFSELFLRLSKGRDAVSVFSGISALELLGFERKRIEAAWLACDSERLGFLGYEAFMLACELCARPTDKVHELNTENATGRRISTPIVSNSYLESERVDMLSHGAMGSYVASEAQHHLDSEFEPLRNASYRVISLLALNSESHESICRACLPSVLLKTLRRSSQAEIKRSIASTLCSVTSTHSEWAMECLDEIVSLLEDAQDDFLTSLHLIAALANSACARRALRGSCFHDGSMIARVFAAHPAAECGPYLTEVIRLVLNISSWADEDKHPILAKEFIQSFFEYDARRMRFLDRVGVKYLCELILRAVKTVSVFTNLVSELRFVEVLICTVSGTILDDSDVAPRISMIFSRICALPELRAKFVGQGGIEFAARLYAKHPLDEIVRLNCVLILGNLLLCSDPGVVVPRLCAAGYKDIIKDACAKESHIEIVSRCLDAWRVFGDYTSGWGSGILTVASFLTSSSVELKLKSLHVLEALLAASNERDTFCLISAANPTGSVTFIELILGCLPRLSSATELISGPNLPMDRFPQTLRLDCLRVILRIISIFARDRRITIAGLLNQVHISSKLYEVYPLMPEPCKGLIIETLSELIVQDPDSTIQLIIRLVAPGQPSALELLVSRLAQSESCVDAVLSLSGFPPLVHALSEYTTEILTSIADYEVTASSGPVAKLTGTIAKLCESLGDTKVASNLHLTNVFDTMFRLILMDNEIVSKNAAYAIWQLSRHHLKRYRQALMRPSRMNSVIHLLKATDSGTKRLGLKILSLMASCESSKLLEIACGDALDILIREIMQSGNMNWLGLLCHLVQENRTRFVLRHHDEFLNFLDASIYLKSVGELVRVVTRAKLVLNEASRRAVLQLFILHTIYCPGCDGMPSKHLDICGFIFLNINLNEFSRLQPPPAGTRNDRVEIIKLLTGLVSSALDSASTSPFGLNHNQFRYRSLKFKDAMQQSLSKFGENIFSKCLERVYLESKRTLNRCEPTRTVKQ